MQNMLSASQSAVRSGDCVCGYCACVCLPNWLFALLQLLFWSGSSSQWRDSQRERQIDGTGRQADGQSRHRRRWRWCPQLICMQQTKKNSFNSISTALQALYAECTLIKRPLCCCCCCHSGWERERVRMREWEPSISAKYVNSIKCVGEEKRSLSHNAS